MQHHTIKVFQKTAEITLLRFLSPQGELIGERELSFPEIERFATEVERKYRVLSYDPTAALPALGRELYEWLDGPTTRWLAGAMNSSEGMTLRIDVAEKLRHLPWELLHTDAAYLCFNAHHLFTPARLVTETSRKIDTYNRPLRTLFMACSAEDVQPLLDFETEEKMILESARRHQIEIFVEESGSLDGLRYQVEAFGRGYFDVFHMTGHADVDKRGPRFLMENDRGLRQDVSAEEVAEAFQGNWPRLVFLSGCRTGQSPEQGYLPSFCEALVQAGAPAVLGWALPVYDVTANLAAGELYGHLAAGKSIDEAVARTRLHLLREGSPDWHLLRLYVNATPLEGMVTASKTPKRARLHAREASREFLDAGAKVEVCKREDFVGRRRSIQRCLQTLQSREGEEQYAEGVLLHGMGGLGKSSLAARLCERMPGHKRIVIVGALDELGFIGKISSELNDPEAIGLLNQPGLNLTQRLRNLLAGSLSTQPVLFVLDDFEQNLEASGGGYIAKSVPLEILKSLLTAIRKTSSESRVIVTSRYQFLLPSPPKLRDEGMESLRGGELEKKLTRLKAFDPSSSVGEKTRERARALGAGNPRLLEWLDKVLVDGATDATPIMDAMELEAERFRETVLLRELLSQLSVECRRMMALASIYELPFDRQAVAVAVDGPLDPHLGRAVSLGLIEGGTDPATGESRYFVSRIALPLVEQETTAEERGEAARRAAKHLHQTRWQSGSGSGLEEALEIFRLALAAREQGITAEIGGRIARAWVNSSRYREAEALCQGALNLGEDHRLLGDLARAQVILGRTTEARRNYERALSLCPDSDVSEKSGIKHNLANLVAQQGDVKRALDLWQESLALQEQIGYVKGKATTLHQMAGVIAQQGDVKRALELWQESLALDEQIGDVKGKAATLHNMAGVIAQQGDVKRALELWQESLALDEQIGDVKGKADTLHNMAGVIARQGDVKRALDLWQQSLEVHEQIGDVKGKAATLSMMAGVIEQQGDVKRALELWQQSLAHYEQIGDVKGKAATLSEMAGVIAQQGDVKRALELWQESLALYEQIGDVQGKADTLHNMAGVIAQQGDVKRALELWQESLALLEQIGDVKGKAATLHNMAGVIEQQGDVKRALDLWQQSLALLEQIGDVKGKATTLHQMAGVIAQQGDVKRARGLWQESLALKEQIGDVKGKAATLQNMAGVIARQGDVRRALGLWQESLALLGQIGDVKGKAATLHQMAGVIAQQGDVKRALELWQESLALFEQIGDVKGKAATLHNMAGVIAQQGDIKRALELWQESLALDEQIGDVQGKAATLHEMAGVIARQGDVKRALELWQESLALLEQIGEVYGKAATLHEMARVIARQGDVRRALDLWQESLALSEQIGDIQGKADTLRNVAGVIARQGDVQRALELWQESLALKEQIGDVKGKADTLHNMAGVIARQGDVQRALELWQESLALKEQIGDVKGKADTLHNMAGVIAQQGDVKRALDLWQESLEVDERIGDVKGKADTLHNMAGVIAQQGDIKRALDLWQESLALSEQIGDVKGKADTLHNMGWLAAKNEDFDEARRLYFEAGKSLAAVRAWLDLITVLSNLSALPIEGATEFLAQAAWLTIRVESPVEETLNMIAALLEKLGTEHEMAPLLGAAAYFIAHTRGQHHPQQEKLVNYGMNILGACAAARKIERQDQFQEWFTGEGLNDPKRFMPALSSSLEEMVGEEEWLFDRKLFEE